jgi:hypothetical protein
MNIEDIEIIGTEILETTFDAEFHRLDIIAEVVDLLLDGVISSMRRVCVLFEGEITSSVYDYRHAVEMLVV